jgi:lipoyl(octanoyl) transferase
VAFNGLGGRNLLSGNIRGVPLAIRHLGQVEYREALALQEALRADVQEDRLDEVLLLLEHPPVYTRGRRSGPGELPMGEAWYLSQGIDIVEADRGGKVTYHGPGQLVGYPIMRIDDVVGYVHTLESAIVNALAEEGIEAHTREGLDFLGVWVGERKIASIGVHVQRGVTTHGFAVNVDNDLQPFEWIVPCGLGGVQMTSICKETRKGDNLERFREVMARHFATAFDRAATQPKKGV